MTAALPKSIRLRTLNALVASMIGTSPNVRRDVDAIIKVFETDEETDPGLDAYGMAQAATQMLKILSPDLPLPSIAVLDHREEPFDALWATNRVQDALKMVGEANDILFWVVGLQDQYLEGTRARSARSRQAYAEAVESIQTLVAHYAGRRRVTVVVL
jgi:hypothetical protein